MGKEIVFPFCSCSLGKFLELSPRKRKREHLVDNIVVFVVVVFVVVVVVFFVFSFFLFQIHCRHPELSV